MTAGVSTGPASLQPAIFCRKSLPEGREAMATKPHVRAYVPVELVEEARAAAGLAPGTHPIDVIRFAVALLAGRPDPLPISIKRRGKQPADPVAVARAQLAYRAALAAQEPITRAELARQFGITQGFARRIVAECRAESQAA